MESNFIADIELGAVVEVISIILYVSEYALYES